MKTVNILNSLNEVENTALGELSSDPEKSIVLKQNGDTFDSRNNSKNRKAAGVNDKEQIIMKTLNLEERRRLIKQHQKLRQVNSKADEDFLLEERKEESNSKQQDEQVNNKEVKQLRKEMAQSFIDKADDLAVIEEEVALDDIKSHFSRA